MGGVRESVTMDELEGCFDSLANAAVTGKDTLESLVNSNSTLTKTNAELSETIKTQVAEIKALKASLASSKASKKGNGGDGGSKPSAKRSGAPTARGTRGTIQRIALSWRRMPANARQIGNLFLPRTEMRGANRGR